MDSIAHATRFERLFSDNEVITMQPKSPPPAIRGWCLVSIVVNSMVVAIATAILRNAAPLLLGAILTLFPLWMLLFWSDLVSNINISKQRTIEQISFALR